MTRHLLPKRKREMCKSCIIARTCLEINHHVPFNVVVPMINILPLINNGHISEMHGDKFMKFGRNNLLYSLDMLLKSELIQ